jgi:DNA-directed RNA polymerase subunit RPC12/RpoP
MMYFNFPCSNCGKNLKVREELAGRRAKCPYCQTAVTIPVPASPEPAASEESESARAAGEGAAADRGGGPATGAD